MFKAPYHKEENAMLEDHNCSNLEIQIIQSEKSLDASPHELRVHEHVNEPVHEPVHESVHKPVHEPVQEPVHEPVHKPVHEPGHEHVQSRPPTAPKRVRTGRRKNGLASQTLTINANTLHPDTARYPRYPGYSSVSEIPQSGNSLLRY